MAEPTSEDAYEGVFGAFPYAFGATDSRLCRVYIVVGGLFAALATVVFVLAVISLIGETLGTPGGLLTSARAFYVLIALLIVGPLLAPTLLVARRHRRGTGDRRYDRALGTTGFLFLVSLYLGAVASMPASFVLDGETITRPAADGVFGPLVELLYAIPEPAAPVVPALAVAIMALVHRRYR
ncbi:conserved hypothetical protein [Halorhabdus utahensis DSM 12940]|uniref:DUF8056 domain-containing protein n=1 Tax=Halorhabdus utahensis (strain DSM 12940 / JCM 11049 / AX-2) TaxID=519442 RepID=C7NQC0_HALUD|nr:hypothetical protein [Halorhabdus utahensis]ACV12846.1 conserved hypothetical protein [Halorhabdus utahensis DSM 12940]